MTFRKAVEATPHLEKAWEPGLRALRAEDRPHIEPEDTRRLRGSVDVDKALQPTQPQEHRWDFAIAYQHTNRAAECIYWVEIHTASDSQVSVVLDKFHWLKQWLATDGKELDAFEREFVWVSSGATAFTPASKQRRQFAQLGLMQRGTILRIRNARPD